MSNKRTYPTRRLLTLILFVGLCTPAFSEETHDHEHEKTEAKHEEQEHKHPSWELGIASGYVRLRTEKEDASALHLHLSKRLGHHGAKKYFSLGVGTEAIFATHKHYVLMGTLGIHPWRDLTLAVSPGVQYVKHDGKWESSYATHLEVSYAFNIGKGLHLGPVAGYSKTKEDEHTMIGLHLGIPLGR